MNLEEREKMLNIVTEEIYKFYVDIKYKIDKKRELSYTDKILLVNYTKLLLEMEEYRKNV